MEKPLRAYAGPAAKEALEMELTEASGARDIGEAGLLLEMIVEVNDGAFDTGIVG